MSTKNETKPKSTAAKKAAPAPPPKIKDLPARKNPKGGAFKLRGNTGT